MDDSKRDFLKKAGISIVGFGVLGAATSAVGRAIQSEPMKTALTAGRFGMVIDAKMCAENKSCNGACMAACHQVHNVPKMINSDGTPDKKHEVKWIWKEAHEKVFPTQIHEYTPKSLLSRQTLVLCKPRFQPSPVNRYQ